MTGTRIIYLVGFMGSGKTTAGKKLASNLKWSFADLDSMIEENAGMSIAQIFAQHGEGHFRAIEAEILRSVGKDSGIVVSTGGGTPCHEGNMDYMLATGLTVYLEMSPAQLASRLKNSKGERPLIKGLSGPELLAFIKDKLGQRETEYKRSEIIIKANNLNVISLIQKIKNRLAGS